MTIEDLEQLEQKEYLFTVKVKGDVHKDVMILNNALWRNGINKDYQVISYREIN